LRASLLVALALAGCASGRAPRHDLAAGAAQRMERMAEREAASARPPEATVPPPPGPAPEVLLPRAADARARVALGPALDQLAAAPAVAAPAPAPLDDADRDAALRHYVKGRDAALRGHYFVAITELEKAQAIDPAGGEVLRQLACCYAEVGNDTRAAACFERLLRVSPGDEEALLQLGGIAFNRRDFARTAAHLALLRRGGRAPGDEPAAGLLADHMLATALRELGYDRAFIDLAVETAQRLDGPAAAAFLDRWDKLYRQRSELWQSVGDARCRLGEYAAALEAYERCAALPNSQPESLSPRVIYANLCLGRRLGAQAALVAALDGPRPAGEQEIRLCAYVAENAGDVDLLGQAIIDLQRERPDDATLVRAAAVLLPRDEALRLLRAFLHHRPQDLGVLAQLLAWLAERDVRSAVSLTVALCEDRPELAPDYADRLATAAASPAALLAAAATLPPTPARALVQARLLLSIGAVGRAWTVLSEALERDPDSEELLLERLEIAARLNESPLLEEAGAAIERFQDERAWIARAVARRALAQTEAALAAAAEAARLDPSSARPQVELARSHVAHAQQLDDADQRRWHLQQAAAAGEQALDLDPRCEEAYSLLFMLHGPNTVLADRDAIIGLRRRLEEALPASALAARLEALDIRRDGQYRRGLERLLAAWESDHSQSECLETAVLVWAQLGRDDEALAWIEERLAKRPADPVLLQHWVALQVHRDRRDEAVARLQAVLAAEPEHDAARELLENVYRSQGRHQMAVALAEERLLTRPQGVGRELELAAAYAGADMSASAEARLAWVLQRAGDARYDQLASALVVLALMTDHDPRYAAMGLTFALQTVERFPESPLVVYGYGLRALARLGPLDERFDELADRAVRFARGASGSSAATAEVWRALAQDLVDAGRPEAAARAVRARLLADMPLEPAARALLARVAIVADAATGNAPETIALVQSLAVRGWLPVMPGMEREPTVADVIYRASNYYTLLGKGPGAEVLLRETIRLEPDHAMALNNLGYTRLEMGHADAETAEWIERAARLAPGDGNVLDTLGWLRYKTGRFDEGEPPGALRLIRESLRLSEQEQGVPSVEVLDHLGDTLWRLGDAQGAVEKWRTVTEMLEDPELRDRVQQDYEAGQARTWGLRVGSAAEMYEREYGAILVRARQKLAEVERGGEPPVAPTFHELEAPDAAPPAPAGRAGDAAHGRP
jgi:Flp pilus assembly protein TadD